jgi:HlyD family secretion protein
MKRLIRWTVILAVIFGGLWLISIPFGAYMKERNRVQYRDAAVTRGTIVAVVNATGTVKPVQSVSIGSFVSGPITEIYVDFNTPVKKGDRLALVDPKIYKAYWDRDKATKDNAVAAVESAKAILATRKAEVNQAWARLEQAKNDEKRAQDLQAVNKNFISATEMDKFKFDKMALKAAYEVAETTVDQAKAAVKQADAAVKQAEANFQQSDANLEYTKIISPVDGVVIDRKIDPGQTMAAQFQTPELFIVAPNLREEMRVYASVDESDIGYIKDAEKTGQPVRFTVDAYPDELFAGKIVKDSGIRMSSTTTQNVVTYPVVISAPNPDLKLMPGMTASISFQLREKTDVLRIPNAALRYYPVREHVRPEDRELLESKAPAASDSDEGTEKSLSAAEKAESRRKRNRRYVWVVEGDFLRAVAVVTGLSNSSYTELISGELNEGQQLVTGVQAKK